MSRNRKKAQRGTQGTKDSRNKRVNFDNTRAGKFQKDIEQMEKDSYPKGAKRTEGCNDIAWYANNPELLRSAASVPFSWTTGTPLPFDIHGYGVPGVMSLLWSPYVGMHNGPIVAASNSILSYVVHANSRNLGYDANDIMLLILAGAQVFSAFALGVRAYGVMRRYAQQDAYTPDALLMAMGFDPEDLRINASKMWFDLNQLSAQLQQIWIPDTMPIIERWFWMNSQIFKDGESVKAQYYMFTPAVFYKYDETKSSNGGSLQPIKWKQRTIDTDGTEQQIFYKWSDYVAIVNDMLSSLLNSQDRGVIFGDILKAYGAEHLYSVSPIAVDYTVEPVYDKEVLTQIENATFFSNVLNSTQVLRSSDIGPIIQEAGKTGLLHEFIPCSIAVASEIAATVNNGAPIELPLNFHQIEVPTPEQVMIATRLRTQGCRVLAYAPLSEKKVYCGPAVAGTEVLTDCLVYITQNSINNVIEYPHRLDKYNNTDSWGAQVLNVALAFDWAPMLIAGNNAAVPIPATHPLVDTVPPVYNQAREVFMEYDNYTVLHASTVEKMHTTAVYSLLGVPTRI